MKRIPFFKKGKHTAASGKVYDFTDEMVKEVVETYNPTLHEAPLVIGHPKDNAPAFGWVQAVELSDGIAVATPHKLHAEFAESTKELWPKRSASLFSPDAPGNPTPGKWHLRHIGFLGAVPPAVKGLPEVEFNGDAEGVVEFSLGEKGALDFSTWSDTRPARMFSALRSWIIDKFGLEEADKALPSWMVEDEMIDAAQGDGITNNFSDPNKGKHVELTPEQIAKQKELDAREAEVKNKEANFADITNREAALTAKEQEARRAEYASFCDARIAEGKLLPSMKDAMIDFMMSQPGDVTVEFSVADEKKTQSTVEFLQGFITSLPPQVNFSELGGGPVVTAPEDFSDPVDFANAIEEVVKEHADKGKRISVSEAAAIIKKQGARK